MRRLFVGGNWKCNLMMGQAKGLVAQLNKLKINNNAMQLCVSPVFTQLQYVAENLQKDIIVSSQNLSLTGQGAFTGEISYFFS